MLHNLIQFIADDQSKWDQTRQGGNLVLSLILTNFMHIPGYGN